MAGLSVPISSRYLVLNIILFKNKNNKLLLKGLLFHFNLRFI